MRMSLEGCGETGMLVNEEGSATAETPDSAGPRWA